MANIELVIKIPKEKYEYLKMHHSNEVFYGNAIANGILLPEHHGDLKDVSKLDVLSWQGKSDEFTEGVTWAMEQLDSLSTIIPATKEGEVIANEQNRMQAVGLATSKESSFIRM